MIFRAHLRDQLTAAAVAQLEQMAEGRRPEDVPDTYRARADALAGGLALVLPGSVVGPALGLPVATRAPFYRLTEHDALVPLRVSRDCLLTSSGRCRRAHDHWETADDLAA